MLTIVETSNPQGNPSGLEKGEIKQSLLRKDSPAVGKQRPGNQGGGGVWQLAGVIDSTSHLRGNGDSSHKARALFVPAAAILPRRRALGDDGPILALSLSFVFVSQRRSCAGSKPSVFGISCLLSPMAVGRQQWFRRREGLGMCSF